jgi:hypothetical protein
MFLSLSSLIVLRCNIDSMARTVLVDDFYATVQVVQFQSDSV